MDCWCCFPCFGICKKSKRDIDIGAGDAGGESRQSMGEREPLLPKGSRQTPAPGSEPGYTSSAPDCTTGTALSKSSALQPDAFRDQLSDVLVALNTGKVPSQGQINGVLRGLLSSGVFDEQVQSEAGFSESEIDKNLLGDMQELIEALLDFGVEKNGDDKLQEIHSEIVSLMSSELGFDTTTLLSAFRTLALAALASPSFRHIVNHFASIFKHSASQDGESPTPQKETIVVTIREIIERMQTDYASRCAMRAILILVRKYAHILPALSLAKPIGETTTEIDIPGPALSLLENIKEVLERCAGGESLDTLLSAFALVMRDLQEDENSKNIDQSKDDAAPLSPPIINEEESAGTVETGGNGEDTLKSLFPITETAAPAVRTDDITPKVDSAVPAQQSTSRPPELPKESTTNSNGSGSGINNDNNKKKTSARNRKKNQKAKMKKKQKAMEKKAQELKLKSIDGLEGSAQDNSEDEGDDVPTGIETTTQSKDAVEASSSSTGLQKDQQPSNFSKDKPEVSLSAFLTRLGLFLDDLLSESESEDTNPSDPSSTTESRESDGSHRQQREENNKSPPPGSVKTNPTDIESLVDDAIHLFVDRKGDYQPPLPIHSLLAEVHHFTHALENDYTFARLCGAAGTFRRDVHLAWCSESSARRLKQLALKGLLRALPLPLPLPLTLSSNRTSLPLTSRSGLGTTRIPDVELKMGNWQGVLTDLWVSGNSGSCPSMFGGGDGSKIGWKRIMEGARVVKARLLENSEGGVGDDRFHDEGNDDNDENNDNDADETTTLLSSTQPQNPTKSKRRSPSKSTVRTQTTYTSNGTTRAGSSGSDPGHSHIVRPTKSQTRLRIRIQVPLNDLAHRHPLRIRVGMENARYRVCYNGPCSGWFGYEDQGVVDVEFGVGHVGKDREVEVEVEVDLGLEEEGEEDAAFANEGEGEQLVEASIKGGENKQEASQSDLMVPSTLKSASTLSLYGTSTPHYASPSAPSPCSSDRASSHLSLPLSPGGQTPTMPVSELDDKASAAIPEIIVNDSSSEEDSKEDIRNEEAESQSASFTTQHLEPDSNGNAKTKGKGKGQRQSKSIKVLSTTVVALDRLAFQSQEDLEIDISRKESTSHHWPTTDLVIRPLGGSRGPLIEQMVRLAVKRWMRNIMEDLVREAVEEWLTGFLGGCERVWEVAEMVFGGESMF